VEPLARLRVVMNWPTKEVKMDRSNKGRGRAQRGAVEEAAGKITGDAKLEPEARRARWRMPLVA
jgi:hypothetical protein